MSHPIEASDDTAALAHVWVRLATDLQGQAIWLLTQLAMHLVTAHPEPCMHKELPYDGISYDQ